jgi:uncharacterized protein YbaA (DUF1428 family)
MQRVMDDPRLSPESNPMPFDGKRVIFGLFDPVVELGTPRKGGYFDGYVIPVPRAGRERFIEFARYCDPVWLEYGANWVVETWGIEVPDGKVTDFRRAVQAGADEEVVFSWVQWPDRATRDQGMAAIMNDERFADLTMPFDGKRMIYGGFTPVVE